MVRKMRRLWIRGAMVVMMALGLSACEGWLDVEEMEQPISTLTENVNFTAEKVLCKRYDNIYADYYRYDNFFLELTTTPNEDGEQQVMILDLLLPDGTATPEGEYQVGYVGNYIALSRLELFDPGSGMLYMGGSYYGTAREGFVTDYYGFLTEGKVIISSLDGEYYVTVDAKSKEHKVYVYYHGPMEIIRPK